MPELDRPSWLAEFPELDRPAMEPVAPPHPEFHERYEDVGVLPGNGLTRKGVTTRFLRPIV